MNFITDCNKHGLIGKFNTIASLKLPSCPEIIIILRQKIVVAVNNPSPQTTKNLR